MKRLLDQYRNNELPESETEALWQHLIQAKLDKDLKQQWANQLRTTYGVERNKPPKIIRFPTWWKKALMVAATLLVLLYLAYIQGDTSASTYERLAAKYIQLTPPPLLSTLMGSGNIDELWGQAKEAIDTRNYARAGNYISKIIFLGKATIKEQYWLGICYLWQKEPNYAKAVQQFEKVVQFNKNSIQNKQFEYETNWYLGLAYLGNRQEEQAKRQFQTVVNNGEWMVEEAKKALKELE